MSYVDQLDGMAFTHYDWHLTERIKVGEYWDYEILSPHNVPNSRWTFSIPPMPGDLIHVTKTVYLDDDAPDDAERPLPEFGTYRVVERCFGPAAYGSPAWPYVKAPPACWVDIIVERADGPFRNERPRHNEPSTGGE